LAKPGDKIKQDKTILILEAMKMEMQIIAPKDRHISEIFVSPGDQVASGDQPTRVD